MTKESIAPQLKALRNEIDEIDSKLVELLAKRRAVTQILNRCGDELSSEENPKVLNQSINNGCYRGNWV